MFEASLSYKKPCLKRQSKCRAVVAHALSSQHTWEAEAGGISEFEASLVYRAISRIAKTTQRNPDSKKKKKKKKTQNQNKQPNKQKPKTKQTNKKQKRVESRTSKVLPGRDVSLNPKCLDCMKALLSSAKS